MAGVSIKYFNIERIKVDLSCRLLFQCTKLSVHQIAFNRAMETVCIFAWWAISEVKFCWIKWDCIKTLYVTGRTFEMI